MLLIKLNSDSQLFLTTEEATTLALDLTDQLLSDSEIVIADERLTAEEGMKVLRSISDAVVVNWRVEGF